MLLHKLEDEKIEADVICEQTNQTSTSVCQPIVSVVIII
jgi:hypothetical protein